MRAAMTRMVFRNIILTLIAVFTALPFVSKQAAAQDCSTPYEAIIKLREPDIGAFSVWSGVHGDKAMQERYVSGVLLPNTHVLLVGEVQEPEKAAPKVVLAEVDRRGRLVWQTFHEIQGLEAVLKILPHKDGFVVLGNKRGAKERLSVWIGFFDVEGALKSQRTHQAAKRGSLHAYDLIARKAGGGFLMVAGASKGADDRQGFAEFYRLNDKAQVISKRSYVFGHGNRILGLNHTQDGHVMASGYMMKPSGRRMGWLMKLQDDGKLVWQREYPRGAQAEIHKTQAFGKRDFMVVGTAMPAARAGDKGQYRAGWAMVVDSMTGNIRWQRYFTGDYDYVSRDLYINDDGMISLVLDGDPPKTAEAGGKDFVRLLTLNPRGVIFDSQAYFNGEGTDVYTMIQGASRERILVGASDMAYKIESSTAPEGKDDDHIMRSREGWVVAAPAASAYNDPCL